MLVVQRLLVSYRKNIKSLNCNFLNCILFKEPGNRIFYQDSPVIAKGKIIQSQDCLFIVILDFLQRFYFPFKRFFSAAISCDLKILANSGFLRDEINFKIFHLADIYLVASAT